MSYDTSSERFGHLPVLRKSKQFGVAGLVAQIFLWLSVVRSLLLSAAFRHKPYSVELQGCFSGVVISVLTRLLCKWPGVKTTMSLAIMQGFAGVIAVTAWSLQLPAVGLGRTHRFYYGHGFKVRRRLTLLHCLNLAAVCRVFSLRQLHRQYLDLGALHGRSICIGRNSGSRPCRQQSLMGRPNLMGRLR